jgi:hypothetical protein
MLIASETRDQVPRINGSKDHISLDLPHFLADKLLRLVTCAVDIMFATSNLGASSFDVYNVFAQNSFKLCSCVLLNYMFRLPCGTYAKGNWKWITKYADCVTRNSHAKHSLHLCFPMDLISSLGKLILIHFYLQITQILVPLLHRHLAQITN